jgi:hypothetical protein
MGSLAVPMGAAASSARPRQYPEHDVVVLRERDGLTHSELLVGNHFDRQAFQLVAKQAKAVTATEADWDGHQRWDVGAYEGRRELEGVGALERPELHGRMKKHSAGTSGSGSFERLPCSQAAALKA